MAVWVMCGESEWGGRGSVRSVAVPTAVGGTPLVGTVVSEICKQTTIA